MGLFDTTQRWQVYIALNLVFCIIGSLASSINIAVISRMKRTGYLLLLLTMNIFQLIYVTTLFFSNVNVGYWVTTVANIFQIIGGIGESIMSNWIALVVLYIVSKKKSCDIFRYYHYMLGFSLITSITNAIVYIVAQTPKNAHPDLTNIALLGIYYYIRLGSIMLNFLIFGLSAYFIWVIRSKGLSRTAAETAITTLSRRLIYYPVLQAICRSGYAYYEMKYGAEIDQANASATQYDALVFLSIVTPLVSVGYLIIFLLLQPSAYDEFRALCGLPPRQPASSGVTRPSRATMPHRRTSAHPTQHTLQYSPDIELELTRKSTAATGDWGQSTGNFLDAMNGSERGTSFADWAKSSIAFLYEDTELDEGFDERTEEELFAALDNHQADVQSGEIGAAHTTELSTTNNALHPGIDSEHSSTSLSDVPPANPLLVLNSLDNIDSSSEASAKRSAEEDEIA